MEITKPLLEKLHFENKISQASIARKLGVSPATICKLFKEFGIKSNYYKDLDEKQIVDEYNAGKSVATISIKHNVSISPIKRILKKHNVGIRDNSERHLGQKAWNKGKKMTEEQRKKLSSSRIGKYTGKDNPNWKGGISKYKNHPRRMKFGYRKFMKGIRERDKKCLECHSTNRLEVHHIKPVRNFDQTDLLLDPNNCITLCKKCHVKTIYKEEQLEMFYRNLLEKAVNSGEI